MESIMSETIGPKHTDQGEKMKLVNIQTDESPILCKGLDRKTRYEVVEKNPQGAEVLLHALDFMLASPLELVVAGDSKKQETQIMLREINRRFLPSKVLLFTDTSKWDNTLLQLVPFLENQKAIEGKATFYACQNQTCDKPRTELQEVIKFLDGPKSN